MKPYGIDSVIEGPDVADIQEQARKGSIGRFAGRSGESKSYIRNTSARRITRIQIKRNARRAGKNDIKNQLEGE